jgi:hypothetical protein
VGKLGCILWLGQLGEGSERGGPVPRPRGGEEGGGGRRALRKGGGRGSGGQQGTPPAEPGSGQCGTRLIQR